MGLFSSIKKVVKKAAPVVVPAALTALGSPAAGALAGSLLGSDGASSGGLSGIVGLGQDLLSDQYNLAMQKDLASFNAAQQQALNDRAFQQNLQMWHLKNAYDSPAEQMKRYEQAGLNPNLIYGQSNTSGSIPQTQPATYNTGEFNPVNTRMQRAQMQLALMEHQQRVTNQAIQNDLARQRLVLAEREADRSDRLANAQIDNLHVNLGLTNANIMDKLNNYQSFIGKHFGDLGRFIDRFNKSSHKNDFDLNELMKGL